LNKEHHITSHQSAAESSLIMPPKSKRNKQQREATAANAAVAGENSNSGGARAPPTEQRGNSRGTKKKENRSRNNNNNNKGVKSGNGNGNNYNSNAPSLDPYPPYWPPEDCLRRYADKDPAIVRGKLRVLPTRDGASFVTCDRGFYKSDVCVTGPYERNRALDGDLVYVELLPLDTTAEDDTSKSNKNNNDTDSKLPAAGPSGLSDDLGKLDLGNVNEEVNDDEDEDEAGDTIVFQGQDTDTEDTNTNHETWQDDAVQMNLWNPVVPIARCQTRKAAATAAASDTEQHQPLQQRKGRVVYILPPKSVTSEIPGSNVNDAPPARRRIVGSLKVMKGGTCLLTPNNKSLPQFKCPPNTHQRFENDPDKDKTLYAAEYEYLSWGDTHKWPPVKNVQAMGKSCVLEDEIQALVTENGVDHGDFTAAVLKDVDRAVESGVYLVDKNTNDSGNDSSAATELDWKPTPDMYKGRRDYRKQRIFTIDPTTARDLDDALHVTLLPDGRVEIGVHIADVSFFIQPGSAVDQEAQKRATTVYLVDRIVPMLPRPLCEVACSLNENVERLAFSCVWTMNMDGTLRKKGDKVSEDDVWYGRTVIKSCARLDYSTAQNIIDGKVATGESGSELDEKEWPKSRRPTGDHTIDDVASDVRLMHRVAMARRKLRFDNGALALHGIKLTFQLGTDGQTPLLAKPYPIRDSNRLIEEYMLLANYLVAQRLISHAKGKALLRQHPDPSDDGLDKVVEVAKLSINFDIDASTSQTLHASLRRLSTECNDPLVLQSVTQMLMTPMQPADYFAAGQVEPLLWRHFALNIPYYTHFTR
jgi:DIS3-like exonuclease 2